MRTDRLALDARPVFERVALVLAALGVTGGVCAVLAEARLLPAPVLLVGLGGAAVLAASTLRGRDDTLPFKARLLALGAGLTVGLAAGSLATTAVGLCALAGVAMAGTGPMARKAAGAAGGAVGAAWALAVLPRLDAVMLGLPFAARAVVEGLAAGVFFATGLLALHVRVHPDGLTAQLEEVAGETGAHLRRVWGRCHAALAPAPVGERREVLRLLEAGVREAQRLTATLNTLDARLLAADRKDAEAQIAALRADAAGATDATARHQLLNAAGSLSDSLEALDALERKRERLGADLRLKLATLDRAAMALESAQGEPGELRTLALRLAQPASA